MQEITTAVKKLLGTYGFSAFASQKMTEEMLRRHFPEKMEAAEACVKVLYLPGYLSALKWLVSEPRMAERRQQLWSHYAHLIETLEDAHLREAMLLCNTQMFMPGTS